MTKAEARALALTAAVEVKRCPTPKYEQRGRMAKHNPGTRCTGGNGRRIGPALYNMGVDMTYKLVSK